MPINRFRHQTDADVDWILIMDTTFLDSKSMMGRQGGCQLLFLNCNNAFRDGKFWGNSWIYPENHIMEYGKTSKHFKPHGRTMHELMHAIGKLTIFEESYTHQIEYSFELVIH